MEPEITDAPEVIETPAPAEETVETPTDDAYDASDETIEQRLARIEQEKEELEKKNKRLYARLKEGEKAQTSVPSNDNLNAKDVLALTENRVSADDYDEVIRVAKILGKPIHEALKDSTMKAILTTRAEERKTASATQVRGGTRAVNKTSGEDLLSKAEKTGELPETSDGFRALAEARLARKRSH